MLKSAEINDNIYNSQTDAAVCHLHLGNLDNGHKLKNMTIIAIQQSHKDCTQNG